MAIVNFSGQSNNGYLNNGPVNYKPDPLTYVWDNVHHYAVQMQPGVNIGMPNDPTTWGSQVTFAQDFRAHHPDEVLLIVNTFKGSTGVAEDPNQYDWSPNSHGEMFDFATATVQEVTSLYGPLDAVFFMGMETDATDPQKAADALNNLQGLVTAIRDEWGVQDIVMGRISATGAYSQQVREAQWQADQLDPHLSTFKTIGLELRPDGLHYGSTAYEAMGHQFYESWVTQ